MSYKLDRITFRTNNTAEGMKKIGEIWRDILNGKLPILFDSEGNFQHKISPVSVYSNYSSNGNGDYDLTIIGATPDFFVQMESDVSHGLYAKYDESDDSGNIEKCAEKAWKKVWADQKSGIINRSFENDFESTVPSEYTKDKKAHCYLYISIQK